MTLQIELAPETWKALRKLKKLDKAALYTLIDSVFDRQSAIIAGSITKNFLSGQRLNRRTGTLARSIVGRGTRVNGVPGFRVGVFRGPALKYAGIHEEGGEIRPVKAKALAIPLEAAQTAAGVDRFGGPRDYPGELHFQPTERGIGILANEDGVPIYRLVAKVSIEGQHYLRDGMKEGLPGVAQALAFALKASVSRAMQGRDPLTGRFTK